MTERQREAKQPAGDGGRNRCASPRRGLSRPHTLRGSLVYGLGLRAEGRTAVVACTILFGFALLSVCSCSEEQAEPPDEVPQPPDRATPHIGAISDALASKDTAVRHQAIIAAQWLPLALEQRVPTDKVVRLLSDGDPSIRFMAATVLGDVGAGVDEATATLLVESLKGMSGDESAAAAYTKLLCRSAKRDGPRILQALGTMSSESVRKKCALMMAAAECGPGEATVMWMAKHAGTALNELSSEVSKLRNGYGDETKANDILAHLYDVASAAGTLAAREQKGIETLLRLQSSRGSHLEGVRALARRQLLHIAVTTDAAPALGKLPESVQAEATILRNKAGSDGSLKSLSSQALLMAAAVRPSPKLADEAIRRFCAASGLAEAAMHAQVLITLYRMDAENLKRPGLPQGHDLVAEKARLIKHAQGRETVSEADVVKEIQLAIALLGAGQEADALAVMGLAHTDIQHYAHTVFAEADSLRRRSMDMITSALDSPRMSSSSVNQAKRLMDKVIPKMRKGRAIQSIDLESQLSSMRHIGSMAALKAKILSAAATADKRKGAAELLAQALRETGSTGLGMDEEFVKAVLRLILSDSQAKPKDIAGASTAPGLRRRRAEAIQFVPHAQATDSLLAMNKKPFFRPLVHSLTLNPKIENARLATLLKSESSHVRANAAFAMGLRFDKACREPLVSALATETDDTAKVAMHFALAILEGVRTK